MILRRIRLSNFRCYDQWAVDLAPGANLVCGPNGVGKTTLLEAMHLLFAGRSFRTAKPLELVRQGEELFVVEAQFIKHGIEQTIRISCGQQGKSLSVNSTSCPSWGELLGQLCGVSLVPDDMGIVKGGPGLRRLFLDQQLCQSDHLYLHHLRRYRRALAQRNSLLRKRITKSIEVWEHELAVSGTYLVAARKEALEDISRRSTDVYRFLADGKERLHLHYKTAKGELAQLYADARSRELERGFTSVGPHCDDLVIGLDDRDTRIAASEGQQRTSVAALKVAEWQRLHDAVGFPPLMLVDDLCQSLDAGRQGRLGEILTAMGQVVVTATSDDIGWSGEMNTITPQSLLSDMI